MLFFCLNCRMFGDPIVRHLDTCSRPILVRFVPKLIGWHCRSCGAFEERDSGPPPRGCTSCQYSDLYDVYEYPEELRRC